MFSRDFYLLLHILSLMVVFLSLGGVIAHMWQGGTRENLKIRKPLAIFHGVALTIAFISGFGLMARGGFSFSTSYWMYIKLFSWLLLGGFPMVILKKKIPAKWGILILTLIGFVAVYTVVYKPM